MYNFSIWFYLVSIKVACILTYIFFLFNNNTFLNKTYISININSWIEINVYVLFTIPFPRFSGAYTSVTIAIDKLTLPLLRPPITRDQTNKENVVAFAQIM